MLQQMTYKALVRAKEIHNNSNRKSINQTRLDFCIGYIECLKDMNEMLSSDEFRDKFRYDFVGYEITEERIDKILEYISNCTLC
jgi:catalase (peroxidase I)